MDWALLSGARSHAAATTRRPGADAATWAVSPAPVLPLSAHLIHLFTPKESQSNRKSHYLCFIYDHLPLFHFLDHYLVSPPPSCRFTVWQEALAPLSLLSTVLTKLQQTVSSFLSCSFEQKIKEAKNAKLWHSQLKTTKQSRSKGKW